MWLKWSTVEGQQLLKPDQLFAWGDVSGEPLSPSPFVSPPSTSKRSHSVPVFERVDLGESGEEDGEGNDITDELREKHHRKCEYEERRMRKLEKEQLVHDRYKLQERQEALEALELEDSEDIPEEIIALSSGISLEDRPLALELQQKLLYDNNHMLQRYDQLLKSDIKGRVYPKPQYSSDPSPFDVRKVDDKGTYSASQQMRDLEQRVFKMDMQSPFRIRLKIPPSTKKLMKTSQSNPGSPLTRFSVNRTPTTPKGSEKSPAALSLAADARLSSQSDVKNKYRTSHRSLVAFGVNIPNEIDKQREFSLIDAANGFGVWSGVGQEYNAKKMWEEALSYRDRGEAYIFASTSASSAQPTVSLPMATPRPGLAGHGPPATSTPSNAEVVQGNLPEQQEDCLQVISPAPPQSPTTSREKYAQLSTPKRGKKRGRKPTMVPESAKKKPVPGRGRGRPPRNKNLVDQLKAGIKPDGESEQQKPTIKGKGITYVYGKFRGRRKITDPLVLSTNPELKAASEKETKTETSPTQQTQTATAEAMRTPSKKTEKLLSKSQTQPNDETESTPAKPKSIVDSSVEAVQDSKPAPKKRGRGRPPERKKTS